MKVWSTNGVLSGKAEPKSKKARSNWTIVIVSFFVVGGLFGRISTVGILMLHLQVMVNFLWWPHSIYEEFLRKIYFMCFKKNHMHDQIVYKNHYNIKIFSGGYAFNITILSW